MCIQLIKKIKKYTLIISTSYVNPNLNLYFSINIELGLRSAYKLVVFFHIYLVLCCLREEWFCLFVTIFLAADYDLTGQVVWPGAVLLNNYLTENAGMLHGCSIIELGSGVGKLATVCLYLLWNTSELIMHFFNRNHWYFMQ